MHACAHTHRGPLPHYAPVANSMEHTFKRAHGRCSFSRMVRSCIPLQQPSSQRQGLPLQAQVEKHFCYCLSLNASSDLADFHSSLNRPFIKVFPVLSQECAICSLGGSNWWIAIHHKSMKVSCQKLICWIIKDCCGFPIPLAPSPCPSNFAAPFPHTNSCVCPCMWPCLSLFCMFTGSCTHFILLVKEKWWFREKWIIWPIGFKWMCLWLIDFQEAYYSEQCFVWLLAVNKFDFLRTSPELP